MDNTDYTAKALRNRQKRKRQVRYHTITLILSLFILITIPLLFASFSTAQTIWNISRPINIIRVSKSQRATHYGRSPATTLIPDIIKISMNTSQK